MEPISRILFLADVYSMSIVHWELFRMCKELNGNFNGIHELPYQHELGAEKATIDRLQGIVSKGMLAFTTVLNSPI